MLNILLIPSRIIEFQREEYLWRKKRNEIISKYPSIFKNLSVRSGPFKGLKLSSPYLRKPLFPKLLGTYEWDIKPLIEKISEINYQKIINVGCAEGYYAIGFAVRNDKAEIIAIDEDEKMLNSCEESARLNNVSERVTFSKQF